MEGNLIEPSGFWAAGKPILIKRLWAYDLKENDCGNLHRIIIYKNDTPYWTYHSNGDGVRRALKPLFDLCSNVSETLPIEETRDFLLMLHLLLKSLSLH